MRNSPCLNCSKRSPGCHDECKLYMKYKYIRKNKSSEERDFDDYLNDAMRRMQGSGNGLR